MGIVGGFDLHRRQITFDVLDTDSGVVSRGVIRPAIRLELRRWLGQFEGREAAFVVEGTTGWRFVVEELRRAGMEAHLAEPAETRALRGPKRRAKTDRADARHLRQLLAEGRVPESWIPPAHLADLRTTVRLRKSLVDMQSAWDRRIQAQLFHHGLPEPPNLNTLAGRLAAEGAKVPAASRQVIAVGFRLRDAIDTELERIDSQLGDFAQRQRGCRELQREYGVGPVLAPVILAELGDTRRFSSARQAVRYAGLDVTVSDSDGKGPPGQLSRQGSSVLRWALYEAAGSAWRTGSPDHDYYLSVKDRLDSRRARLSVARRMLRRISHHLAELGDPAFAPLR